MDAALLDTDILSELLKQRNAHVSRHATQYLHLHRQIAFSVYSRFEILRGYKEKGATRLLAAFETFCQRSLVMPATDAIFERAADMWAYARKGGHPYADADLIIAATAIEHHRTLVTGNNRDFAWIPGLTIVDWRSP